MNCPIKRIDFVHDFLAGIFAEDLHAKRVASLANGALGVMTSASLAVSIVGHSLAQARGLLGKHAIKQVDRLLSNQGIVVWDMFAAWAPQVVGQRKAIVVAMDWTDFDAHDQTTLALNLVSDHGRATPLLWLTVLKDELKDRRKDFEDLCLARLAEILPDVPRDNQDGNGATIRMGIAAAGVTKGGRSPTEDTPAAAVKSQRGLV